MDIKPDVKERVFAVADRLSAELEGATPKLEDVRKEVGIGMNQVSAAMRLWRESRRNGAPVTVAAAPAKITDAGARLMADLWAVAVAEASAEISKIKADAEAKIAEEIAASSEMADEVERLQADLIESRKSLESVRAETTSLQANLSAATESLKNADQRISEYRDEIANVRISEREAVEDAAKYRGQVEILTAQLADVMKQKAVKK
jgi:colicin import membrane protein